LRERRSIRIFKPSEISEEVLGLIVEAGVRAPTSLQSYTIIHVRDPVKRDEVAKLCSEEIVRNASAIFLICSDLYRTKLMLDILGHEHVLLSDKHPVESIFAVIDAALMTENMIIAAEALGLGSVVLDCPLIECRRFIELFKLPRGVMPLFLLCIGERGELPPLRPRLPLNLVLQVDEYEDPDEEELESYLRELAKHMDRENYVRKYTGMSLKYLDYLKLKTELSDENKRISNLVEKAVKENLFRF